MAYTGRVPKENKINEMRCQDKDLRVCAPSHLDSADTESPIILNTAGQATKSIMVKSLGASELDIWGSVDDIDYIFLGKYSIPQPSYFDITTKISIPWYKYQWFKFDRTSGVNVKVKTYSAGLL